MCGARARARRSVDCKRGKPPKEVEEREVSWLPHMWARVRPLVVQGSLMAGLGVGLYALRSAVTAPLHPSLAALGRSYPGLAAAASALHALGDEAGFARLVAKLEEIARLDVARGPAAQWQISRLSAEVVRDARELCRRAPAAESDAVFQAVLQCTDETVPQIQSHLDDLLHNHLLARA